MKFFLTASLYVLFTLKILELVDKSYFDFSFISFIEYIIIIVTSTSILFYIYLKNIALKENGMLKLIFIMLGIILIPGTLLSEDIVSSLLRGMQLLIIFILIIGSLNILGAKKVTSILYKFLFMATIVIILLSDLLLYIGDFRIFSMGNFKSFFSNANGMGSLIGLLLIPILINKLFDETHKVYLFIYFIILINLIYMLYITNSRSALLSFIVIAFFLICSKYIIFSAKKFRNSLIIISVLLMSSIVIISNKNTIEFLTAYIQKHEDIGEQEHSRSIIWDQRIHGIYERPLLGWGYGINSNIYREPGADFTTEKGSSILSIVEELGFFFGLTVILIMLYIPYKLSSLIIKNKVTDFRLVLVSMLIGSLMNTNFESWLFYLGNFNSLLFWFILLSLVYSTRNPCKIQRIKTLI